MFSLRARTPDCDGLSRGTHGCAREGRTQTEVVDLLSVKSKDVGGLDPNECDEELARYLAVQTKQMDGLWFYDMTPAEARVAHRRLTAGLGEGADQVTWAGAVLDESVPMSSGSMRVRVYRPPGDATVPVVIYFHGGGWVFGDIATSDPSLQRLCLAANVVVVSVDYPLAPEHPFPEPLRACVESVRWSRDHSPEFGGDPLSLLVMGDSAGGNLAAATAIECARAGISLAGQVVLYGPLVHYDHTALAGVRDWSERDQRFGPTFASTQWYWSHYIPPSERTDDARANPLLSRDLQGVAPALISYGTLDTYGEECLAYARLLDRAGVDVLVTEYPRLNHGYMVHGSLPEKVRSTLGYEAAIETCEHVRELAYGQLS